MTPAQLQTLKARLDNDLLSAADHVGIAFGMDAYLEFMSNGWLVYKPFHPYGIASFSIDLPTYKDHYAGCDPERHPDAADVGK